MRLRQFIELLETRAYIGRLSSTLHWDINGGLSDVNEYDDLVRRDHR
jgi:hypothetical protein